MDCWLYFLLKQPTMPSDADNLTEESEIFSRKFKRWFCIGVLVLFSLQLAWSVYLAGKVRYAKQMAEELRQQEVVEEQDDL